MASKKVRRAKKAKTTGVKKGAVKEMPASPLSPPKPKPRPKSKKQSRRRRTPTEAEMREEYAYVIKDLRRVFILAIAMFALLIVLNIVLG